jgi:hypothetical protein
VALLLGAAAPAHGETLREALADAWATNPTLGAAREGNRRWNRPPMWRLRQGA